MKHLRKFNDYIYYLPYRKRGDRPNLYYIKGKDYSIAIDAGTSREHLTFFYNELERNGLKLPRYTVISHWHWDHTFALPYINGESISTELTSQKLQEVAAWEWTRQEMRKREKLGLDIRMCNHNIRIEYPNLADIKVTDTDIAINEPCTLDLGDLKVELIPKQSTHSEDSLYVYIENMALFAQDSDWIDPYVSYEYDQIRLKNMIDFLESLNYHFYFYGHIDYATKEEAIKALKAEIK